MATALPRRLRTLRLKRNLTQAQLAERAGVSANHVARLERGEHDPTVTVVMKLAKALGVKVEKLVE